MAISISTSVEAMAIVRRMERGQADATDLARISHLVGGGIEHIDAAPPPADPALGTVHRTLDTLFCDAPVRVHARGIPAGYRAYTTTHSHLVLRSETTGRCFVLDWKDVYQLALQAGIDEGGAA
ncbi:MAG: hypothetical protein WED00_05840 [Aquisalimonadaceae bacterium]